MADSFLRADGWRIEPAPYADGVWWVYDPSGRHTKSYTADTLEDADRRLTQDLEQGRVRG